MTSHVRNQPDSVYRHNMVIPEKTGQPLRSLKYKRVIWYQRYIRQLHLRRCYCLLYWDFPAASLSARLFGVVIAVCDSWQLLLPGHLSNEDIIVAQLKQFLSFQSAHKHLDPDILDISPNGLCASRVRHMLSRAPVWGRQRRPSNEIDTVSDVLCHDLIDP